MHRSVCGVENVVCSSCICMDLFMGWKLLFDGVVFPWISSWIGNCCLLWWYLYGSVHGMEIVVCCGSICMDQIMDCKLLFAVVVFVWISSWDENCCLME